MALVLKYCQEHSSVPENAVRAPGTDAFVAVDVDKASNAFGFGKNNEEGGIDGWFPYNGTVHHSDGPFSFLIKNPDYSYVWVTTEKILAHQTGKYKPLEVDGVCPAIFAGRVGKVQLCNMAGRSTKKTKEIVHSEDEVRKAHLLCARKRFDECYLEYFQVKVGQHPPPDAVQAKECKNQSFVVLSRDFSEPTYGRASLNAHRDGLQAWFPYNGGEHEREKFEILRHHNCVNVYWEPISEVLHHGGAHEIVHVGHYAPAILNGLLGKVKISEMKGWTSYGGKEIGHDKNVVLAGKVLCFKDHDDCLKV